MHFIEIDGGTCRKLGRILNNIAETSIKKNKRESKDRKKEKRITGEQLMHCRASYHLFVNERYRLKGDKKREILKHFNKEISANPKILTNILEEISFSTSELPAMRRIIENQGGIGAKTKGKRTRCLRKIAVWQDPRLPPDRKTKFAEATMTELIGTDSLLYKQIRISSFDACDKRYSVRSNERVRYVFA